ncbi:hypothetical protein ASE55_16640 [Chryseobacterium sp. Leaf201]|nr:hypothetical protein ASE55_16640 [Chryseobacterium sp. Leaf201]
MIKQHSPSDGFLERVVNFDFERFYTRTNRIICHVLMWLLFAALIQAGYYFGYKFTFVTAFFFSIRLTLCNIIIFYLLFYFIIPQTLNKNRAILFIILIPICFQLWLLANHYYFVLLYKYHAGLEDNILYSLLKQNNEKSALEIISIKNVISHAFDVIVAISPFLFIKITFDMSRIYAASIITNRENQKLQYQNVVMEKKFLQTQLNPHFLFNTLNNLYGLTIKKDDIAPELILKLSEIMRYTLYDINVEEIPVQKEIDFIENYFEMEKMRYPAEYDITLIVDSDDENTRISPLLFFTFIENAFKYGLKSEIPYLKIYIETKEKKVYFAVENDTPMNTDKKDSQYGGIGIDNVKKRLCLLYPDKHELNIQERGDTFIVELKLDLSDE